MKKSLLSLTAAAIVTGSALLTTPASAIDSRGVKDLTYHESTDLCISGQALPCTVNAGNGSANVLRIVQTTQPNGSLQFDAFTTTSLDQDYLWMAATITAECRTGYDLSHAAVRPHYAYAQYKVTAPDEVQPGWGGMTVSTPDAPYMPSKKLAVNIPVQEAFDEENGFIHDFNSLNEVYEYAESRIDLRKANGMNEAEARSIPFTYDTWVVTHAEVRCSGPSRTFVKKMPRYLPLQIQFVPVARPTIGGSARPGGGLTFEPSDHSQNG